MSPGPKPTGTPAGTPRHNSGWLRRPQPAPPRSATRGWRAILRGYDLPEPDQAHAVRLVGSVFRGMTH